MFLRVSAAVTLAYKRAGVNDSGQLCRGKLCGCTALHIAAVGVIILAQK